MLTHVRTHLLHVINDDRFGCLTLQPAWGGQEPVEVRTRTLFEFPLTSLPPCFSLRFFLLLLLFSSHITPPSLPSSSLLPPFQQIEQRPGDFYSFCGPYRDDGKEGREGGREGGTEEGRE